MANRALAGLRVIEMTEAWVGPVGASMMGDLGADVVKVESYPRHSMTRPVHPRPATMPGPGPVYEKAATHGRMLPEGLHYVDSWVVDDRRL